MALRENDKKGESGLKGKRVGKAAWELGPVWAMWARAPPKPWVLRRSPQTCLSTPVPHLVMRRNWPEGGTGSCKWHQCFTVLSFAQEVRSKKPRKISRGNSKDPWPRATGGQWG